MVIGTGIVFWAQASQLYICTSVPQMEVLRTRMRTSSPATSGTGTFSSHNPGSAFAFTTACIVFCTKRIYPQISQIHTDYERHFLNLICENLCNLWTNFRLLKKIGVSCPRHLKKLEPILPPRAPSSFRGSLARSCFGRSRF